MSDIPLTIQKLIDRKKWTDYRGPIWGDSYNWSWNRPTTDVKHVVIHHSVTAQNATPDDVALLHKARGWAGIGYHFVITMDGMVWYVGDVGTARANVLDMNEQVIGVCLIGDFTKYNPTDEQILSAHDLAEYFINAPQWPNCKDWTNGLKGHMDLQATACPGSSWKGAGDSMYERIKNRIPYSPVVTPDLPPVDPPPTVPTDCEKQIAGYKSRITDITNQLDAEKKAHAVDKTEIVNLNDKLANIDDKCQREKALLQGEIDVLKKTSADVEVLKRQYVGTITDLEGKLREAQKATGLVQLDLAACQADTVKVSALSRLLQWLFHYGDNK